ncbi:MAG: phasin family protein [Sphingomonadaceae bacterium]
MAAKEERAEPKPESKPAVQAKKRVVKAKASAPKASSSKPRAQTRKASAAKAKTRPTTTPRKQPKSSVAAKTRKQTPKQHAATKHLSVNELKDKIMATAKKTDYTDTMKVAASKMQEQFQSAYEKSSDFASEAAEFTKANVEAVVESGKIFAAGVQEMSKGMVEESKGAYETATADFKKVAAVKSPTEFFQLQSEIARRNFDLFMSASSKNTEAMVKLTNEAIAPISSRVSVAVEKISKAA